MLATEFGVQKPTFTRFPDILVEPFSTELKERRSQFPVMLVEVLSPSTTGVDLTEKPAEYMSFDTLEAYVVASQDEPICWMWQRTAAGSEPSSAPRVFPQLPAEISGRDQSIGLTALGIELPLAEIYRGIA